MNKKFWNQNANIWYKPVKDANYLKGYNEWMELSLNSATCG